MRCDDLRAQRSSGAGGRPLSVSNRRRRGHGVAPLAGKYASLLFAFGLLNAAIFTASILPLSTAYYVCEASVPVGVENRFSQAPVFYSFYAALIVIGGGIVLVASDALQT